MKNIVPILVLLAASAVDFLGRANSAQADSVPPIVINEIETAGAISDDEFIELFNPSDAPIDLKGYKLSKKTKTGSSESTLVSAAKFSGTIQAYGYFLIAHPGYKDKISADLPYSGSTYYISNDNTVFLYDKDGMLLDKVGFGTASDFEGSPASNPDANQSIERTDFIDTDDNTADFSINISPSPQNSSVIEDDGEELPAGGESPEDTESNNEESPGGDESPEDPENNSDVAPDTPDSCAALSSDVRLNEIFPYPASGEEFAEVVNSGTSCVDISGWKIMDETGHKKEFPEDSILYPGEYLFLEGNLYLNNDSDAVYLLDLNGDTKGDALDNIRYEHAVKNSSFSFDEQSWYWTSTPTPGAENIFDTSEDGESNSGINSENTNPSSSENVYLSEILPNPKDDEEKEFIEIVNGESGPVDLFGWMIRDGSKSGKYVFRKHVEIGPGEYLAIYKSESKIALNNSGESVYLYNPEGRIVSSASYEKSTKNSSYNFDGKSWKWSKYLTPGKKNKLDSEPSVKIKKIKHAFMGIFTEFSAAAKDKETKKLKYAWDFGDGKKSYLKKTSHKYLDTGKYTVTLSVSDDSQTVEKDFTLQVKKYPRSDLEIVKIFPNPAGNDSDRETIDIKNNSGKKIDLQNWKIATGSGEKIYNHPISGGTSLGPNEIKTITREMSKFALNNKAGKAQLISPDGKIADEVEYSKEKIAEGEAYAKTDGEWRWIVPPEKEEPSEEDSEEDKDNNSDEGEVLGATDEYIPHYAPLQAGYTPEDKFIFFKFFGLLEYKSREINFCPLNQNGSLSTYLALPDQ